MNTSLFGNVLDEPIRQIALYEPSCPQLSVIVPTLNERENVALLIDRLSVALTGILWEVIVVDDNSKDGTIDVLRQLGSLDRRIRSIRRIRRRGLSGACLEGILSSSAPIVAIIDADLQHDERLLPRLYERMNSANVDLAVATRYREQDTASEGFSGIRHVGSQLANKLASIVISSPLSDPMSGFFMIRRSIVEELAPRLSQRGFKLLLDIVATARRPLKIEEISYTFRPRLHGESKLDANVVVEYVALLVSKLSGDLILPRFFWFGLVGSSGVLVNLAVLRTLLAFGARFTLAQMTAMVMAMIFNYTLNNALTFRDRRRRGVRFFTGLLTFSVLCGFGLLAGVGVGATIYQNNATWWAAGLAGAAIGAVWNYVSTSAITWRAR